MNGPENALDLEKSICSNRKKNKKNNIIAHTHINIYNFIVTFLDAFTTEEAMLMMVVQCTSVYAHFG